MNWIKVEWELPPTNTLTGESEWVFVYRGNGYLPKVARYSNGTYSKEGWELATDLGKIIPLYSGRGAKRHLNYTHWANIVLPE